MTRPSYQTLMIIFPLIHFSGKISPWSLCLHIQVGPAGVHMNIDDKSLYPALYYPIAYKSTTGLSVTGFTRLCLIDILPAFHQYSHFNLTLQMDKWHSYLGNTSYCQDFTFKNALTGDLLASGAIHNVHVDFKSRKPVRIPEKWRTEINEDQLTHRKPPQGFKQPPRPNDCYIFTTTATSSWCDSNQHQNMAIHMMNCWDAGSAAACNNQLSKFTTDLAYYDLKQLTFLYQGEVVIGDVLQVACWEHPDNPKILCFTMIKRSQVIGQCQMEFYPVSYKQKAKL